MTTNRHRLPNRRPSATRALEWHGREVIVTVGFDPATRQPREVFASGPKEGSDMLAIIADACVVISLALQHGAAPQALAKSLGRVPAWQNGEEGEAPASVIGAILEVISEENAAGVPPIRPGGLPASS